MSVKHLFVSLLFLTLTSCSILTSYLSNRHNKKLLKAEKDPNTVSYSDNFHIYKTRRTFSYEVEQKIKNESIKFKVDLVVMPIKKLKGGLIKYLYEYNQKDIETFNLQKHCPDSLEGMCHRELSTVKENKSWVWLHPPRSKTLEVLEVAPFPEIRFGKDTWNGTLSIPKGSCGKWEDSELKWTFKVDTITYRNDTIPESYYIQSKSVSKFGVSTNDYKFHIDSGFTYMHYDIENEGTVVMKLVNIKDESNL